MDYSQDGRTPTASVLGRLVSLGRVRGIATTGRLMTAAIAACILGLGLAVQPRGIPAFEDECVAGNPYYATSCLRGQARGDAPPEPDAPSVLLFRDTAANEPSHSLATYAQTGPTWGLAYRASEPAIYAASYHKRGLPHGPGGPGAIYRIDLATGAVAQFATVPNVGADAHRGRDVGSAENDLWAAQWVGKRSLGDLELSIDQSLLFVVNLADRRIYRFAMPSGSLVGAFGHGATGVEWSEEAHPFALAVHEGHLYHAVVDSGVRGRDVRVYRSTYDGSQMQEVARLDLTYSRPRIRMTYNSKRIQWQPWDDPLHNRYETPRAALDSQPMPTDIEFTRDGKLVLALHDRRWDIEPSWLDYTHRPPLPYGAPPSRSYLAEAQMGFGDLLLAEKSGEGFQFEDVSTAREHFDDRNSLTQPESALGGLARARLLDAVVGGAFGVEHARNRAILGWEGVYWWEPDRGNRVGYETTCRPGDASPFDLLISSPVRTAFADDEGPITFLKSVGTLGDVEALCRADSPTPTPTATTTATATATSTSTSTATSTATAIPTATREPEPIYLPIALREECVPERSRADIVLVVDASSSMAGEKIEAARQAAKAFVRAVRLEPDQVGVVAFNRTSRVASELSADLPALEQAIASIDTAPGTRIDTGLEAAAEVLSGPRRRPEVQSVVIVMTDGIQEEQPARPNQLADQMRDEGTKLFVIGLGTDVDVEYLGRLAGGEDTLHLSPTTAELAGIYERIARLIPCPPSDYWGGR